MKTPLNAANVIASIAGTLAAETATGGVGAAISGAMSLHELWRRFIGKIPAISQKIAQDLQTELERQHLTDDQKALIPQMVELAPLSPAEVMAAARNPARICDAMLAKLTDPAHCTPATQDAFTRVLTPVLTRLLADTTVSDALRPAFEDASAETLRFIAEQVETLTSQMHATSYRLGVQDTLVRELARRYAPGSEGDFESARLGLEKALETAAEMQRTARLPHNAADQVDAVLAELDALNAKGDLDAGAATLATARAAARDRIAEETSGLMRLLDSTVAQSRLRNAPQDAADALVEKLLLDTPADTFIALRALQGKWYELGSNQGLDFEATVAIHLAVQMRTFAQTHSRQGMALNDLGIALATLGRRETTVNHLNDALEAYTAALQYRDPKNAPLDWAMTQMNIGNTLIALYGRDFMPERFEQAIIAFSEALKERTRERMPLDWAMTQSNLGNAFQTKGDCDDDIELFRTAVIAYGAALQEFTYKRTPNEWAMAQNNLGSALLAIGRREPSGAQLVASMTVYIEALKVYDHDSMPLNWALTQMNLAKVRVAIFDKSFDRSHLLHARFLAIASREIFIKAQAAYDIHSITNVLADISARETPD